MTELDLPSGWERWSSDPDGPIVLVYRPDVFDGSDLPTECIPTIYLSPRRDPRQGPRPRPGSGPGRPWMVELRLEPAVIVADRQESERPDAIRTAVELASAFAAGEIEYREAYQVPRERYLDTLDTVIGGVPPAAGDESAEREA